LEPSSALRAAWDAEESALRRGDIEAAVAAIVDAWTLPDAPAALRDRVARMQRRALELQATVDPDTETPAPVEEDPRALGRVGTPALLTAGEFDMPDFRLGAEALARQLPDARSVVIPRAGHLAPLEEPEAFEGLLLGFLRESSAI
jgi:pimeloyl-ACP methyl ester carboxylesterase